MTAGGRRSRRRRTDGRRRRRDGGQGQHGAGVGHAPRSRGLARKYRTSAHQVQEHVERRRDQHHALHDRVVAVEHAVHQHLAEAGDGEDLLGQHGAREQPPELDGPQRDDRDQRVAQRVLEHHQPLGHALGPRRAHVVGAEDLQHGAARVAHHHARHAGAEHEGGHEERGQVAAEILPRRHVARGRQPAQAHREEQDQHDAEPEVRHREPGQRDRVGRHVHRGAAPRRPTGRRSGCRAAAPRAWSRRPARP